MAESFLHYTEAFERPGLIRVDVCGNRDNLSWAILDMITGEVIEECKRGAFLFPGLTDVELAEAQQAVKSFREAPYGNAYIRFNDLPQSGYSTNYATGEKEAGISCYEARWDLVSGAYKRNGDGLDGAANYYIMAKSPVYLVTGEEIGRGSDGEPLLKNVNILAKLTFDKEKDGYML